MRSAQGTAGDVLDRSGAGRGPLEREGGLSEAEGRGEDRDPGEERPVDHSQQPWSVYELLGRAVLRTPERVGSERSGDLVMRNVRPARLVRMMGQRASVL